MDKDAIRFMDILPTIEHGEYKFPYVYVSRLNRYDNPHESIEFRIRKLHPDMQDYCHLYIATETSDKAGYKAIIVKFVRRHSIELHALCAGHTHAPRILGFERLPGGWFAIPMDYIVPTVHPSQSPNLAIHCNKWTDELESLNCALSSTDRFLFMFTLEIKMLK